MLWSNEDRHNENEVWIQMDKEKFHNIQIERVYFTKEDLQKIIRNLDNWNSPSKGGV